MHLLETKCCWRQRVFWHIWVWTLFFFVWRQQIQRDLVFQVIHRMPSERKGPHPSHPVVHCDICGCAWRASCFQREREGSCKRTWLLLAAGNFRRQRRYGKTGSGKRINRPIQGHGPYLQASGGFDQEHLGTSHVSILRRQSLLHQYGLVAQKP